jgi:oligopeptide/dipeptide ABC transporter ATP-binding protein
VLIADEPTTALDVTIQAQILDLLRRLQDEEGMGILLITHDLGVIAENANDVAVMYAGKVVEMASAEALFGKPRHPYTVGLFRSLPALGQRRGRLESIPGTVPSAVEFPDGCRFKNRCAFAADKCDEEPPLEGDDDHAVACWFPVAS